MGRMKEIFMEVVQEEGTLPEDFNLGDYMYKKRLENEEWQQKTELEEIQRRKNNRNDEGLDENSISTNKE
jgi:hypothetical protein